MNEDQENIICILASLHFCTIQKLIHLFRYFGCQDGALENCYVPLVQLMDI